MNYFKRKAIRKKNEENLAKQREQYPISFPWAHRLHTFSDYERIHCYCLLCDNHPANKTTSSFMNDIHIFKTPRGNIIHQDHNWYWNKIKERHKISSDERAFFTYIIPFLQSAVVSDIQWENDLPLDDKKEWDYFGIKLIITYDLPPIALRYINAYEMFHHSSSGMNHYHQNQLVSRDQDAIYLTKPVSYISFSKQDLDYYEDGLLTNPHFRVLSNIYTRD